MRNLKKLTMAAVVILATAFIITGCVDDSSTYVPVSVAGIELPADTVPVIYQDAELEYPALQLTAVVGPDNASDKSGKWYSSDETIATVDNGLVTPESNGEVTISFIKT
ncbi:hypothetical protein FACS189473_5400 [Spirochaetia bacterium]|nr:hypothetical protein FACS189473_5400 [Spirochaetia bacterium]